MKRKKAREICRAMRKSTVAVIGDIMLDRYIWGSVDRISPEAPVPVVAVEDSNIRLGGAANVACNLVAFDVETRLVGILGRDYSARDVRSIAKDRKISTDFLVSDAERITTEKIRIVAHGQQVVRADFEAEEEVGGRALKKLLASVRRALDGADVVVISDYGKGVICAPLMDMVRDLCTRDGIPIMVDPKEGHFSLYRGAYVVSPNKNEAGRFYNVRIRSEDELERVGRRLLDNLEASAILLTRGEEGMSLFMKGRRSRHFPTSASEVYDVTGAGDTVIAVFAAAISAGATINDSIELANAAAGLVVKELGTVSPDINNLISVFKS